MKTNVALIGFMGTGKTTVGRALAIKLGREFIETDALIEAKAGKSIPDIFDESGEIGFREMEIEVTRAIARRKSAVIACGGVIVLNRINIDRLREESVIVCLTASPAEILRRTSSEVGTRPLLSVADRMKQISELLKFRRPFYERSADITINTSKIDIETVIERIIEKLRDYEGFSQ